MTSTPLVVGVLVLSGTAESFGLPGTVVIAALAVQIPIAYGLAVAGVARARRGDSPDWSWLVDWASRFLRWRRTSERTFATVGQSQRWLEWRRNGSGLTLAVLLSTPWILMFSFLTSLRSDNGPALTWIFSPVCILLIPVVTAVFAGAEFGLFRVSPRDPNPCSFLTTRPMSCADFVLAKLRASLRCVLVCYSVALPAFLLVTLLTGWQDKMIDGLLYLSGKSTIGAIGIALLTFLLLPALTWKFTVENIFIGLCGRKWVTTIVIPCLAAAFWLMPALVWWISRRPELAHSLMQAAPWSLVSLVVAKLLFVAYVYRLLKTKRLVESAAMRRGAAFWLATVIVVSGLALWLIPTGLAPWHSVLCGAVLMVPLARIGLAPLALAWNRHR